MRVRSTWPNLRTSNKRNVSPSWKTSWLLQLQDFGTQPLIRWLMKFWLRAKMEGGERFPDRMVGLPQSLGGRGKRKWHLYGEDFIWESCQECKSSGEKPQSYWERLHRCHQKLARRYQVDARRLRDRFKAIKERISTRDIEFLLKHAKSSHGASPGNEPSSSCPGV